MRQTILMCSVVALAMTGCAGSNQSPLEDPLAYSSAATARYSYTPYVSRSHAYYWAPSNVGNDVREFYIVET